MTSAFQEIIDLKAELEKKMKDEGATLLKKHFTQYFDAFPEVDAVRWTQYTPYFNDGEPCEFGVGEFTYKAKGAEPRTDSDYEDGFEDGYGRSAASYMRTGLDKIPSDILEAVFGDHVQVTATRAGFEIEEHEHD